MLVNELTGPKIIRSASSMAGLGSGWMERSRGGRVTRPICSLAVPTRDFPTSLCPETVRPTRMTLLEVDGTTLPRTPDLGFGGSPAPMVGEPGFRSELFGCLWSCPLSIKNRGR